MSPDVPPVSRATLTLLFAAALVPRLALYAIGPERDPERALHADSRRYVVLAKELYTHQTFGKPEEDGLVHQSIARLRLANGTLPAPDANGLRPESFRTPIYPSFLAIVQACGGGLRESLLLQNILGAALTCAVVVVAQAAGVSKPAAELAGLLWAFHPGLVVYDNLILTENLFNVLCLTGLVVAARARSIPDSCLAGLLLGLGTLVRPLGILCFPAAYALVWKQPGWRVIFLISAFGLLPPALWAVRNRAVGEGLRVASVGDINLLYYSAAYAISEDRGEDWLRSWPKQIEELSSRLEQRLSTGEDVISAARSLAVSEFRDRPYAWIRVHIKSALKLFCDHSLGLASELVGIPYKPSGLFARLVLRDRSEAAGGNWGMLILSLAWMLLNVSILVAALWGLLRAFRDRCWSVVVVGGLTTVLFALATGAVGLERFRMPIMLPLLVLVGYGCCGPSGVRKGEQASAQSLQSRSGPSLPLQA